MDRVHKPILEPRLAPDFSAKIILFFVRWRSSLPGWRLETMARLVTSEVEGIRIIEQVLPTVQNPGIRKILVKHLDDERRHATVFSERYKVLLAASESNHVKPPPPEFFAQNMTLLSLVAYLEVQEARAIPLLELYTRLYAGDSDTVDVLNRNIRDEKFHATWTYRQLEQWIEEGKRSEVHAARKKAKVIDRRAFWTQAWAFSRALPRLLAAGKLPPVFSTTAAPLQ